MAQKNADFMQYKTSKVFRILATLQSGEAKTIDRVATETGIAPTRVLQSLKWLSEVGVPIIWMSGKKIRINTKIHPLNYEYIEQYISQLTKDTDIEIVLMDSVDSTNEYLLSLCTNRSIHKTICLAEHMTPWARTAAKEMGGRCFSECHDVGGLGVSFRRSTAIRFESSHRSHGCALSQAHQSPAV